MYLDKIQTVYILEGLKRLELVDLDDYRRSVIWQSLKSEYYIYHQKKCIACHSKKDIHLHHKTYKNLGTPKEIKDLIPLCEICHNNVHKFLNEHIGRGFGITSLESATNYIIKLEKRISVHVIKQEPKLSSNEKVLQKRMEHQAKIDAKKRKEQQKIQKQVDELNAKDREYKHKKLKPLSKHYKPPVDKEVSFTVTYKKRLKPKN